MRALCIVVFLSVLLVTTGVPGHAATAATPSALPATRLEFGLSNDSSQLSWMTGSGIPWKYRYVYIAGGLYINPWTTWQDPSLPPGQYALDYMNSSWANGYIPVLTYYMLLQSHRASDESTDDYNNLNNGTLMHDYYANFTLLLQKAAQYGHTAVIHVEPDLWGYLQQRANNGSPTAVSASVASSGEPDVAAYANNVQGFGQALLHLRDLYAPNVVMAVHASLWSSMRDIGTDTDPTLSAVAEADKTAAFLAATGSWDVIFNDVDDHDAGWWEANGDSAHWWDPTNARVPDFARYLTWVGELHMQTGKPQIVWQVPVGNQYFLTENNSAGHYQDNVSQYFLSHTSNLFSAGLIAVLFGAGNADQTTPYDSMGDGVTNNGGVPTTDTAGFCNACNTHVSNVSDDDGGYLRMAVGQYYTPPPPATHGAYHPLGAPVRVLDTRNERGPLGPSGLLNLVLAGANGVPSNAAAVVLNVTATDATAPTYLTLFPTGQPRPTASDLNVLPNQQVANLAQVQLGGGAVSIYNDAGDVNVIADLQGWVAAAPETGGAGRLQLLSTANRLLDTRPQYSPTSPHPLPLQPRETIHVSVPGAAIAAVLNVTAVNPSAPGYLAVNGAPGSVSTVNYGGGETRANRVFANVAGGQISLYNGGFGTVDVLIDMAGFFTDGIGATTGALYSPNPPVRMLDTRLQGGPIGPNSIRVLSLVQPGVVAGAVNLTVTDATQATYVTLFASGTTPPVVSDVNLTPGATDPNLVVVAVAADGSIRIYNSRGSVDVVVDLQGIYY